MKIISAARKLILRPQEGAPVVSFPTGARLGKYGNDNETPTIVVRNGTEADPSWQGTRFESGVVIVNEVPEDIADVALDIVEQGGGSNPSALTALYYLLTQGCVDQYTTSLKFVDEKLSPAGRQIGQYTGVVKRDDRDQIPVWKQDGKFYISHGYEPRVIEEDILLRTYRNVDGSQIDLAAIPERQPG